MTPARDGRAGARGKGQRQGQCRDSKDWARRDGEEWARNRKAHGQGDALHHFLYTAQHLPRSGCPRKSLGRLEMLSLAAGRSSLHPRGGKPGKVLPVTKVSGAFSTPGGCLEKSSNRQSSSAPLEGVSCLETEPLFALPPAAPVTGACCAHVHVLSLPRHVQIF